MRMSRSLTVLIATLVAPAAQAQDAAINACVGRSGVVRVIEAGEPCRKKERPLSWSVAGASGPAGPAGPQGPAGPAAPEVPACMTRARLRITGITGSGPNGSMDVYAFSFGIQYNPPPGSGTGTVDYGPVVVTKALDATSTTLFTAAIEGTYFPDATLEVLDAAGTSVVFTYDLGEVQILTVAQGTGTCNAPAVESIGLSFATIALGTP